MACDCDTGGLPATAEKWSHPTASIGDKRYSRSIRQPQCPGGRPSVVTPWKSSATERREQRQAQSCPSSLQQGICPYSEDIAGILAFVSEVHGSLDQTHFPRLLRCSRKNTGRDSYCPRLLLRKKKKSLIKSRKLRSHSCTHREGSLGCSTYYWWNQSEDLRSAHQQSTTRTRIRGAYWWGLLPTRCQMASEKPGKPWIFLLT